MKNKTLEVNLVDLSAREAARKIGSQISRAALLVRARKNLPHTVTGKKLRTFGYKAPLDSWRHLLARYLRRILPQWCWIYVGGHHLAIMARTGAFSKDSFPLAKFVEATPL